VFTSFDVPGSAPNSCFYPGVNSAGLVVGACGTTSGATSVGFIRSPSGHFTTPILDPNDNQNSTGLYRPNDLGAIVGTYGLSPTIGAPLHSFVLKNGQFIARDLAGFSATAARGLNNNGDLAGNVDSGSETYLTGFIARSHGGVTLFAYPDPTTSSFVVQSINKWGAVVGSYSTATVLTNGFYRAPNGQFTDVVFPGANFTKANGLNDCGVISGFYRDGTGRHAFYGRIGRLKSLDVPGAAYTASRGLSNDGRVVGEYQDANGILHGFVTGPIEQAACDE
jgi:hypothetical protein